LNPLISIITPSFNRANVIPETAQSIFNQNYPNWEWVITDDGSTDDSWGFLQYLATKDSRVKVFQRNREPKGACTCRNIGVENCAGEYVMFLDDDDLLASFCLQQRASIIEQHKDCDFVIFPMLMFKHKPDDLRLLWNIDTTQDDIERILMTDPVCGNASLLWKKNSFVKSGMWNEELFMWQDVELHLRSLLKEFKYAKRLDLDPDVFIRMSDESLSGTDYDSFPKFLGRFQVLKLAGERIKEKKIFSKYRKGLQVMFVEVFVNAANCNYDQQVNEMMQLQKEWNLFSETEQKHLSYYARIRKYKIYKINYIQKSRLKKLMKVVLKKEKTLNKIIYLNPVKL